MSEDFADRTEAPTPRRREQFRREGKVSLSRDLNGAAVMLAVLLLLSASGPRLATALLELVRNGLTVSSPSLSPAALLCNAGRTAMVALLPLLMGALVVAVLVNIAQIGLPIGVQFPRRAARADYPRISPLNLLASLLKIAVLGLVAWKVLWSSLGALLDPGSNDFPHYAAVCLNVLLSAALQIALVLLMFGLLDYAIQRYRLSRQLRMTRRELREDLRHSEGDPQIRGMRRKTRLQSSVTRSRNRHTIPAVRN